MIYVECKPDFALVKFVARIAKREIVHELNKPEICKRLAKHSNCRGLVDEDPGSEQPQYIKNLKVVNDLPQEGLRILYDEPRNNYIIVLRSTLEDWILTAARETKLNMGKYPLPNTPGKLHKVINLNLDKFERLLDDLKDKDSKRLKALGRMLVSH